MDKISAQINSAAKCLLLGKVDACLQVLAGTLADLRKLSGTAATAPQSAADSERCALLASALSVYVSAIDNSLTRARANPSFFVMATTAAGSDGHGATGLPFPDTFDQMYSTVLAEYGSSLHNCDVSTDVSRETRSGFHGGRNSRRIFREIADAASDCAVRGGRCGRQWRAEEAVLAAVPSHAV
ncbi:hypothetical protein AYI70_g2398 [Smittium culicis]|uniref:Uncharacterized protein n=1 Tax=Smittium culicis TaxID=133412 RepID=A0A1R1Y8C8_9FUNG|nr:hypothetical protein AYI70_g2398 [Smittium culicis]